jgi:hypothetical protein
MAVDPGTAGKRLSVTFRSATDTWCSSGLTNNDTLRSAVGRPAPHGAVRVFYLGEHRVGSDVPLGQLGIVSGDVVFVIDLRPNRRSKKAAEEIATEADRLWEFLWSVYNQGIVRESLRLADLSLRAAEFWPHVGEPASDGDCGVAGQSDKKKPTTVVPESKPNAPSDTPLPW